MKKDLQKTLDFILDDDNYYPSKDYFLCHIIPKEYHELLMLFKEDNHNSAWMHEQLLGKHADITDKEQLQVNECRIFILQLMIEMC
jgi:hypothetical protein